ncbi:hypothetical protein M426DRAFT_262669 [Hypoxylon sp. CI-4A]|nr:hypothetical protein M426DRAFT_262669 [Hypoxylon sp. CI-4A]
MDIETRFLILSDTHGEVVPGVAEIPTVDVAIHCGDLIDESKIEEFRKAIDLLKSIQAPLKLVIAGNHDFTLDKPIFQNKVTGNETLDTALKMENGAVLKVYASPYTPSLSDWGFQFHPDKDHDFAIPGGIDVVIAHGPPHGILDYTDGEQRAGYPGLFGSVARSRPKLHCFGHIHEGWGARLVTWRKDVSQTPSHFTDIENNESKVIEKLSTMKKLKADMEELVEEKARKRSNLHCEGYIRTSHSTRNGCLIRTGFQTLFVNAAIQGTTDEYPTQLP